MRRGWGWWDLASLAFFAPWRETGVLAQKRGTPENLERDVF
jgi:hypothetical protein